MYDFIHPQLLKILTAVCVCETRARLCQEGSGPEQATAAEFQQESYCRILSSLQHYLCKG